MKKAAVIIVVIVVVLGVIGGIVAYTNYLQKQDEIKAQKDKESLQQYTREVLDKSRSDNRQKQQACEDYIAKGGSTLDKSYQLDCSEFIKK